jgi:hypothetical protein
MKTALTCKDLRVVAKRSDSMSIVVALISAPRHTHFMFTAASAVAFIVSNLAPIAYGAALVTGTSVSYLMHWAFVSPIRSRRPLHKNIRRHT